MISLLVLFAAGLQQSAFEAGTPVAGLTEKERRLIYHAYGDCVVSRFHKQAAAAVVENVDDETLMKRRRALIEPDCIKPPPGTSIFFGLQADRVRYALADALVRKEFASQQVPDLTSAPPLTHHDPGQPPQAPAAGKPLSNKAYEEKLRQYQERHAFSQFARFGECVVRANGRASKALLFSQPESADEHAAFEQVKPSLGNCLAPGQTVALTKLAIRGIVAVNYYRLAKAIATAQATGAPR